ncbi:MAG: hypothetical protein FD121_1296 [Gallionellaceae bacterium]|nr:MAG: hypothetical protein FD121_1296 [Gallionellaceae bacterium]
MLKNSHIRRPVSVLLMLVGGAMIFLASETWVGALVFVLGILIEVIAIAFKRKE